MQHFLWWTNFTTSTLTMIERHFSSFYFKNVHSSDIANADTDIIKYNSQYISLTLIYNFFGAKIRLRRSHSVGRKGDGKAEGCIYQTGHSSVISVKLSSCVRLQQKYKM